MTHIHSQGKYILDILKSCNKKGGPTFEALSDNLLDLLDQGLGLPGLSLHTSLFQGVTTEDPDRCNRICNDACDLLDPRHEVAEDALERSLPWQAGRDGKPRRRMPVKPTKSTKPTKSSPPSPRIKQEVGERRRSFNKADHLTHVISHVYCAKSAKSEQVDTHTRNAHTFIHVNKPGNCS